MKKLFLVNLILILILFSSCQSTNTSEENQIIRTSIELATSYCKIGNYEKARDVYLTALENSNDYRLYYNLSLVYNYLDDYKSACSTIENCYSLTDNDDLIYKKHIDYLISMSELNKADTLYNQYMESYPDNNDIKVSYAKFLLDNNFTDKAYDYALNLFNENINVNEVVSILHQINKDEWDVVYRVLNY